MPAALLLGYAALRLASSAFTELRELVFAKATYGAAKRIALETFSHLHALSLRQLRRQLRRWNAAAAAEPRVPNPAAQSAA